MKSTYLEAKLEKIKPETENKYVSLEKGIKENFLKIISENLDQDLPFTLLFWDQQQKFLSTRKNHFLPSHGNQFQIFQKKNLQNQPQLIMKSGSQTLFYPFLVHYFTHFLPIP